MKQYDFHPLANIFPLIDGKPYQDLMADILKHGVREPVWLYDGMILDGRNRYRAATAMSVECPVQEYTGSDPTGFVVSLNLHRRHLSEAQRAMVASLVSSTIWVRSPSIPTGWSSSSSRCPPRIRCAAVQRGRRRRPSWRSLRSQRWPDPSIG